MIALRKMTAATHSPASTDLHAGIGVEMFSSGSSPTSATLFGGDAVEAFSSGSSPTGSAALDGDLTGLFSSGSAPPCQPDNVPWGRSRCLFIRLCAHGLCHGYRRCCLRLFVGLCPLNHGHDHRRRGRSLLFGLRPHSCQRSGHRGLLLRVSTRDGPSGPRRRNRRFLVWIIS